VRQLDRGIHQFLINRHTPKGLYGERCNSRAGSDS
jgi:hypothetical protein